MSLPPTPRQSNRPWIWWVLAGLLAVVAVDLLISHFRASGTAIEMSAGAAEATPDPGWPERLIAGLKLKTPFAVEAGDDITATLPAAVRELVASTETFEGKDDASGLRITVVRVIYQDGLSLSIDGAAHEQITSAAAAIGDADPEYLISPAEISHLSARRTDYHKTRLTGDVYMSCLVILRRQELWQVHAYYTNRKAAPTANGILASVRLADVP